MMSVFGWLVTYMIHSSVLLLTALGIDHFFLRGRPHWKEMVWRVALVGGLVTATAQVLWPMRPIAGTVWLDPLNSSSTAQSASFVPMTQVVIRERFDASVVVIAPQAVVAAPRSASSWMSVFPWRAVLRVWAVGAFFLVASLGLSWRSLQKRLEGRRRLESTAVGDIVAELAAKTPAVRAPLVSATEAV